LFRSRRLGRTDEAMAGLAGSCSLTGRASAPRLELAAFHREKGDREAEARYLEEANQIDPCMRSLHDRLGDAYVALGRTADAARQYPDRGAVAALAHRYDLVT